MRELLRKSFRNQTRRTRKRRSRNLFDFEELFGALLRNGESILEMNSIGGALIRDMRRHFGAHSENAHAESIG